MKPLPWFGSKSLHIDKIINEIPEHSVYVEPFFGGGSVFFYKEPSMTEIINDTNDLLVNFFRVIRNNVEDFEKKFDLALHSRTEFNDYKKKRLNEIEDPVERAYVFYYLVRNSWCHLFRLNSEGYFNAPFANPINTNGRDVAGVRNVSRQFFDSIETIHAAHERLKGVTIECLDYKEIIEKYDTTGTFFFFDPPYDTNYQYSSGKPFDHHELKNVLDGIKGTWLLTLDASKKEMFKDYEIEILSYRDIVERKKFVENILVKSRGCASKMKKRKGKMF